MGNANQKLIGPFIVESGKKDEDALASYIHFGCGLWSPDIQKSKSESANDQWYNVISCIKRTKSIKCCHCGEYGASVHCHNVHCLCSYHPECAHTTQQWDFDRPDEAQLFFCIKHRDNMLTLYVEPSQNKLMTIRNNRNRKNNKLRLP